MPLHAFYENANFYLGNFSGSKSSDSRILRFARCVLPVSGLTQSVTECPTETRMNEGQYALAPPGSNCSMSAENQYVCPE